MLRNRVSAPALGLLFGLAIAVSAVAQTERPPEPPHHDGAPPPEIADMVELCATCHGADGRPVLEESAIIWGQEYYYLYVQLRDFASGLRQSDVMSPIASEMTKEEKQALAKYFSEKAWPRIAFAASAADIAEGHQIATAGQCPQCHLGAYVGNSRVPRLANQTFAYLKNQLFDFKYKRRKNAPDIAALLETFSDQELTAMANFLAGM